MSELRNYNHLKVVASWGLLPTLGTIDILDGRVDGDFLATAKDAPRWSRESDGHGNATRTKNNNKGGTVSVTISASSPTNERLSRAVELDELNEDMVGALLIRDLNGNTVIEADGAYLEDIPDVTFSGGRGVRVWVFQCAAIRTHLGGHDLA